jgi:hypothetical protein
MPGAYFRPTFYSFHRGPAVVLRTTVRYDDGRRRDFTSIYGEDVGPLHARYDGREFFRRSAAACFRAVPVELPGDYTLYAAEWTNPLPKARVASVVFALGPDADPNGGIVIAGLSTLPARNGRRRR